MNDLEEQLMQQCLDIYEQAKREIYNARLFRSMLAQYGAKDTVTRLIESDKLSDGFIKLYEAQKLNLTVEALIYENEIYHDYLGDKLIERATKKLKSYGYFEK